MYRRVSDIPLKTQDDFNKEKPNAPSPVQEKKQIRLRKKKITKETPTMGFEDLMSEHERGYRRGRKEDKDLMKYSN